LNALQFNGTEQALDKTKETLHVRKITDISNTITRGHKETLQAPTAHPFLTVLIVNRQVEKGIHKAYTLWNRFISLVPPSLILLSQSPVMTAAVFCTRSWRHVRKSILHRQTARACLVRSLWRQTESHDACIFGLEDKCDRHS